MIILEGRQKSISPPHFTPKGLSDMFAFLRSVAFVSVCVLLLSTEFVTGQPPEVSGYQISWFDDFDAPELDQTRWTPVFSTSPTNNSLHAYLPENVFVAGGYLWLMSTDFPFGNLSYRSGQVISTSTQRYGRFDVRGKLPTSTGMWPAIWLLPDASWPSQGEIDIMENRGDQPFLTSSAFHWGTNPPFTHDFVYAENEAFIGDDSVNYHDSFHTYSAEWDPTQIRFYVDGVHHWTVRDNNVENFLTTSQTSPMRLIINTAIGGDFLNNPDDTSQFPQFFNVDYVYVYDRVSDPVLELDNGSFDENSGSLSDWTLFGQNSGNVRATTSITDAGPGALKIYGQFNSIENFSGVEQGVSVEPGDEISVSCRTFVSSSDSIAGTGNEVFMKFDYYSTQYGAFGSRDYIGSDTIVLGNGSSPNNQWVDHELTATVPTGAVEARVAIVFRQVNFGPGSINVDSMQFSNGSAIPGDVNCDGAVDLLDVEPFVSLLVSGTYSDKADINQDGLVNLLDVDPFISLLAGGG